MAEFSPIFPAHAVERCAVTLIFRPELPEKAFLRIRENAVRQLQAKGFRQGPSPTGFNINPATGQVTPVQVGPSLLISEDGQTQVLIAPDSISVVTSQYLRWSNIRAQLEAVLRVLQPEYSAIVNLFALKLEYWDRFFWTGSWDDFDIQQLLVESDSVSSKARMAEREWHSHAGWFLYADGERRLVNVNVDVQGIIVPETPGDRPSVGIYTMMQDEALDVSSDKFERSALMPRLDTLHNELKSVLDGMLLPEISQRIGLRKGRSQ